MGKGGQAGRSEKEKEGQRCCGRSDGQAVACELLVRTLESTNDGSKRGDQACVIRVRCLGASVLAGADSKGVASNPKGNPLPMGKMYLLRSPGHGFCSVPWVYPVRMACLFLPCLSPEPKTAICLSPPEKITVFPVVIDSL